MLYIIMEGDLKAFSSINLLFKYADDTNLLVPEITDVDINDEFNNVLKWAADNCMTVISLKLKKLFLIGPRHVIPYLLL